MRSFSKFALIFILLLVLGPASQALAQGCTMCRDTTAGSAPQVRAALRKAIPVLGIPAVGLFLAVLIVARRVTPGRER